MAAAAPSIYADFVPPHKLVEVGDKKVLQIDLSGKEFKKEQLSVQIDNHGRLRISGERQVSGNQWTRFRKEFQVPEDCNAGDVRARFDSRDLVLYITMPKLSPEEVEEPDQGAAAAPDGTGAAAAQAQQTAAQAEEKDQEEDKDTSHDGGDDGGREQATVTGRRKTPWTVLLAVVLALVAAAGFYAKYRLMDPSSAEPAPADAVHLFGLSDH